MAGILHGAELLLGGGFLTNAAPHVISGILGRAFQTPFASPPGKGLSSATVNVVWGFANLAVAYLLLVNAGHFTAASRWDAPLAGLGCFLMALLHARLFGPLHGGGTALRD